MFKFRSGVLIAAMILATLAPAFAQQSPTPTAEVASPAKAAAHIQAPANGDAVTSPFKVQIGPSPTQGVAPAAVDKGTSGRNVLLIDTPLGDQNAAQSIKADAQHILFRRDQIAALIPLPPGRHTLQLVLVDASGIPFKPPVQSDVITITVKDPGATAATANVEGAKIAQESRKAAEEKQALEAKEAQEAKARLAEQALAAKEAQDLMAALEARKALEAKQALEAEQALEAKQALEAQRAVEAKLAKEEQESRLALAKQAREAQLANDARQAEDAKRAKAVRKTTAHLGVKHAKARRPRSAMAHLKTLRMPMVLHPERQEIQRPPKLHQRHHHHRAHAHTHRHHHGQLHHHKRHHHNGHHHCHRGHHHHPNKVSNK